MKPFRSPIAPACLWAALSLGPIAPTMAAEEEFVDAARQTIAATVTVESRSAPTAEAWGKRGEDRNKNTGAHLHLGSGVVVSPDGLIVTYGGPGLSQQLVARSTAGTEPASFRVTLRDGRTLPASLQVYDERSGLCLLKVERTRLPAVPVAEYNLVVGQRLLTAGVDGSEVVVSSGVVSALDRTPSPELPPLIQTDLRTTQAHAGGPVVNRNGQLAGIVVVRQQPKVDAYASLLPYIGGQAVTAQTTAETLNKYLATFSAAQEARLPPDAEGWTYVVPVASVRALLTAPRDKPPVVLRPAFLGVQLLQDEAPHEVTIAEVIDNTPAAKAGLQKGDKILALDGDKVATPKEVIRFIGQRRPGAAIRLSLERESKLFEKVVSLAERRQDTGDAGGRSVSPPRQPERPATAAKPLPRAANVRTPAEQFRLELVRPGKLYMRQPDGSTTPIQIPDANSNVVVDPLTLPQIRVSRSEQDQAIDRLNKELTNLRNEVQQLREQMKLKQRGATGK